MWISCWKAPTHKTRFGILKKSRGGEENRWNYIDGRMMTAVLALHRMTGEQKYLDFADRFVGWYVQEDGKDPHLFARRI